MMQTRADLLRTSLGACAAGALFTGTSVPIGAQTPVAVRVGAGTVEPNAQAYYAIDQGFFKKNGIDPQLSILRSGGVIMEGVVAGQLDAGVSNTVSLGSAILRKIPFVVLAPGMFWDSRFPNAAIVIGPNSPIKAAKDLNGLTVGVTSLGSVDGLGFASYMDANGAEYTSLRYLEVVPSAMAETVAQGRVAAGIINDPELSNSIAAGKVKKLVNAYDAIAKLYYGTVWLSTQEWLSKNKETAKRFADAIVAGGEWAENNRPQALVILEKYTKFHEDKSVARYGRKLEPALLQAVWDAAYKYKMYPSPLKATDYCWDGK
jgi:NitT/TauT family transport system substrate-binding protein